MWEHNCQLQDIDEFTEQLADKVASKVIEKLKQATAEEKGLKAVINEATEIDFDDCLNTSELADYIGISKPTLYKWIEKYPRDLNEFIYQYGQRKIFKAKEIEANLNKFRQHLPYEAGRFKYHPVIMTMTDRDISRWQKRIAVKKAKRWPLTEDEITFLKKKEKGEISRPWVKKAESDPL